MPRAPPTMRRIPGRNGAGSTALWEWPAAGPGPPSATAVLVHATGFHSRCWDEVVHCLPESMRCICLDMPGHGRSDLPDEASWRAAARRLLDALADAGVPLSQASVLAGHSMGGHVCTLLAAVEPVPGLLLIDPVIFSKQRYSDLDSEASRKRTEMMHRNAMQRKAAFSSAEEMFERFKDRMPYASWKPRVLRDYCEHGLGDAGPDGMRPLLCKPAVEAACYVNGNSGSADPSHELQTIASRRQRVTLLRAPVDPENRPFVGSATDPALAARLGPGVEDVLLEEAGHFIPMTHPELVAGHIERLARTPSRL